MPKRAIITHALANSLLTVLYVILVGLFMYNGEAIFGHADSPVIPIALLLLFVFSATICGSLMLGRPILWYLDGKKREAVSLFIHSVVFFFATGLIVFAVLYGML